MTSYLKIDPTPSEWIYKTKEFEVTIQAYDDYNKRISGHQLYVILSIIKDGVEQKDTIFSDDNGIISFKVSEECTVSLDTYRVNEVDTTRSPSETLDSSKYKREIIFTNQYLPFRPFAIGLKAKYTGKSLFVGDVVPLDKIEVTINMSDMTTEHQTINDDPTNFIITPQTITIKGDNTVHITYHDTVFNKDYECDIIISGKYRESDLYAEYQKYRVAPDGSKELKRPKTFGETVSKDEIDVYVTIFDGTQNTVIKVPEDEWEFTTYPVVTNMNLGIFEIEYNQMRATVRVSVDVTINGWYLDAWYEGYPIKIHHKYIASNFRIYLINRHTDEFRMLELHECIIEPESPILDKTGWNWYTVKYRWGSYEFKDKVAIYCYEDAIIESTEFSMWYWDYNTHSLVNNTKLFDDACTVGGKRWFNWFKIHNRIIELNRYGFYRLRAPKLCGLDTRFDTEWILRCEQNTQLEAELNRYLK